MTVGLSTSRSITSLAGLSMLFEPAQAFPLSTEDGNSLASTHPSKRAESEVIPLDGESSNGTAYMVEMAIDGILLPVHLDTGSSQLWVAHNSCTTCVIAQMTVVDTPLPENCAGDEEIEYAAGMVSGCLVNTSISIAGHVLDDYPVLMATEVTKEIAINGELYSGTIGLADDKLTNSKAPTVLSALYKSSKISSPEIGFYLPGKDSRDKEGQVVLNVPAHSDHTASVNPVTLPRARKEDGVYVVALDKITVGAATIAADQVAVLDTGSIGIGIPSTVSEDVLNKIYGTPKDEDGGIKVPCEPLKNSDDSEFSIIFAFGEKSVHISYRDLVKESKVEGKCWALVGAYAGTDDWDEKWILGTAFLHNVYHAINLETGDVKLFDLTA